LLFKLTGCALDELGSDVEFGGKSSKVNTFSSIIDFETFLGSTNIEVLELDVCVADVDADGNVVDFGGDIDNELGGDPTGLDLGLFAARSDCFF